MNLSHEDAALFFKLMWPLQAYVNRRLEILPGIHSVEAYVNLPSREKLKVRDALWQNVRLIDEFLAQNPDNLSPGELQIVQSWKRFVTGEFYVFRFLKRYTVFISAEEKSKVYGVLGLYDPLEDVLHFQPPPILTSAVLLPFKGQIIYDGLLSSRRILFGPGYRSNLNEIYQRAKQTGAIIESLEPDAALARPPKRQKLMRDWRPVLDSLVETTEQLKQAESVVQRRAFSVLKAGARLAQAAAHEPGNLDELYRLARKTQTALRHLETALNREGWS